MCRLWFLSETLDHGKTPRETPPQSGCSSVSTGKCGNKRLRSGNDKHTHTHTKHSKMNTLIHGCKVQERLTLFPTMHLSPCTHTHTNTLSNRVSVDVIRAINFLCSSPLRAADDKTTFTDPKPAQENAHTRLCCSWKKKRKFMSHVVLAYFPTECVVSRVTKGGDLCVCAPLRLCYRQTGTGAECV